MTLHSLVGHDDARGALAAARLRDALPSSLLLQGPRGVGKGRMAQWIAQLAACEAPSPAGPCAACRSCRMALALEHPDIHVYVPVERPKRVSRDRLADALEDARIEAVAEMREQPLRPSLSDELRGLYVAQVQSLRRRAQVQPAMSATQTYILLDAELLVPQEASPEAGNALLKLLEEPQERTRLILTSSEAGRLLPTIRSRTATVRLAPLPVDLVVGFLREVVGADEAASTRAGRLSQGSIGRALGFLPDGDDPGPLTLVRDRALALVLASVADERSERFEVALGFPPAGARRLVELFGFVEEWLRDLAAVAAGASAPALDSDERRKLARLVSRADLAASDVAGALPAVDEARELARGNVNPQLIVSGMLRRLSTSLRPSRAVVA